MSTPSKITRELEKRALRNERKVRPFAFSDAPSVAALVDSVWFPPRSEQSWRWMADMPDRPDLPLGYVIEDEQGVAAHRGTFVQNFVLRDRKLVVSAGFFLIADPRLRGASRPLHEAWLTQHKADAFCVLTMNHLSSGIGERYGFTPWPDDLSNVKYVWRINLPAIFMERATRLWHEKRGFAHARKHELFFNEKLGQARIEDCAPNVAPIDIKQQAQALDGFWSELRQENRVLAVRDAQTLAWRVSDPDFTLPPIALAFFAGPRIVGFLLAYYSKYSELELPVLEIMDLIALEAHEAEAIPAMLQTLLSNAGRLGVPRVRLTVSNKRLEKILAPHAAARKVYPYYHGHMKLNASAPPDMRALWDPTPYDGDLAASLRAPPLKRRP